jgi:elongation factor G
MDTDDRQPDTKPAGDRLPPSPPRKTEIGLGPDDDGSNRKRRATITKIAIGEGKFDHTTSYGRSFGHVVIRLEPRERIQGIEIVSDLSSEILPDEFVASAREGVRIALQGGVSIGNPVVDDHIVIDVVARLTGGSFDKDSSDIGYKMAGIFAVREALMHAEPIELG